MVHAEPISGAVSPQAVRICLLGGFQVFVGSRLVEDAAWRRRKAAHVVKLLALAPQHRLHREQVMDVLWPSLHPKAATNNLYGAIHAARHAFESNLSLIDASTYLRLDRDTLALCPTAPLALDVEEFEEAYAVARRSQELTVYQAAIALYRGDLLPDDPYAIWATSRREQVRGLHRDLMIDLARLHAACGDYAAGIEVLHRVVAVNPTDEEAHADLMRLYAHHGKRAFALRQYHRLEAAVRRDLEGTPDATVRRLYDDIAAGRLPQMRNGSAHGVAHVDRNRGGVAMHVSAPVQDVPSGALTNLPHNVTGFIERQEEMAEVVKLLAQSRLLTLTGAGGCGKTRLGLETAARLTAAYPDGVWFVELAHLVDPNLVPHAVATAMGMREEPGRPLAATLCEYLQRKRALLVFDNCEHLLDAAAHLVGALLRASPSLRMLATSRAPLGIAGETTWRVPSLVAPSPVDHVAPATLTRYAAVQLFLDRARAHLPSFELTPANAPAVARLCYRLDGIPLAIELAAVLVRLLPVEQIADRLDDCLKLLHHGDRLALPRQRTMRATIDWSYTLLTEPERRLFQRLAVFAGGFTLEAAEAVAADGGGEGGGGGAAVRAQGVKREEGVDVRAVPSPPERSDTLSSPSVLDALMSLVDQSLVVVEEERGQPIRYRLLEPIRQYGLDQLDQRGADETRRRHAAYFLSLAAGAEESFGGPAQAFWIERLEREHDNLRLALAWAEQSMDDAELGLRLASALWQFWEVRGYLSEGEHWLNRAIAAGGPPEQRMRVLVGAGALALHQGTFDRATLLLQDGIRLARQDGDCDCLATALHYWGLVAYEQGDQHHARERFAESLALRRQIHDRRGIAYSLSNLGLVAQELGDETKAIARFEEALAASRDIDDIRGVAYSLHNLGELELERGHLSNARERYAESLAHCQALGEKRGIAYCIEGLAGVQSKPTVAIRLFATASALRDEIDAPLSPTDARRLEDRIAMARQKLDPHSVTAAWNAGRGLSLEEAITEALAGAVPEAASHPAKPTPESCARPMLTQREREVILLIGRGLTNRQIAADLGIANRTADTHVSNVLRKLHCTSRDQVARWVVDHHSLLDA